MPAGAVVVCVAGRAVKREIAGIGSRALQGCLRNAAEHQDRILATLPPELMVQAAEDAANDRLPAPDDVVGEFGHALDWRRKTGTNQELTERLNVKGHTSER